jgi:uncharacterized protein (DUF58 family)
VRHVNWRVTARRRDLHVNEFHPERNCDVVLFIDSFSDLGRPGSTSLDLAVRGAAGLARYHLARNDRVALVSFGGMMSWLNASSGRAQVHRIVDYLLKVHATVSYAWKDIDFLPRGTLPPLASVVAFSPLTEPRAIKALMDLTARGFPLIVVETVDEDEIVPTPTPEGQLAFRVWRLQREARRFDLETLGVPVVRWDGRTSLDGVLAGVPRRRGRVRA